MRQNVLSRMRSMVLIALVLALTVSGFGPGIDRTEAAAASKLVVFDDALRNGFVNYSWAKVNVKQSKYVHSGTYAISMVPSGEGGLYLYKDRIVSASDYPYLEFWIHGGAAGNQKLRLVFNSGGEQAAETPLDSLLPDKKLTAGKWQLVSVKLADLNLPSGIFDGILLQDTSKAEQGEIYVDDIVLTKTPSAPASGGGQTQSPPPVKQLTNVVVTPNNVSLKAGEAASLQAAAQYSDGTNEQVAEFAAWKTSNPQVVTVANGMLSAVGAGTSVVTATYGGLSAASNVTVTAIAPPPGPVPVVDGLVIYDEQLHEPFVDYSSAQHDIAQSATVHTGTRAISMTPSSNTALYLFKSDGPVIATGYEKLEFWVNGGTAGGQKLKVGFNDSGAPAATVDVDGVIAGGHIPAGTWAKVSIDLSSLKLPNNLFDAVFIGGVEGGAESQLFIDDIVLTKKAVVRTLTGISASPGSVSIVVGGTASVRALAHYSDDTSEQVTGSAAWSSGNPQVASVNNGEITAVAEGTAAVTASYQGYTATVNVTVTKTAPEPVPTGDVAGFVVYDEQVNEPFKDLSGAQRNMAQTAVVHSGTRAIQMDPSNHAALYLYKSDGVVNVAKHDRLEFWLNGGSAGGQKLQVILNAGGAPAATFDVDPYIEGGSVPANGWAKVLVNLPELNIPNNIFDAIIISGATGGSQPQLYVDDIHVLEKYVAPPTVWEVLMSSYQMMLLPGDTVGLGLTANLSNGTSAEVTKKAVWTSSDPSVLSVVYGQLTAKQPGIAKITATYEGQSTATYAQVTTVSPVTVYDDKLSDGYGDWGWGTQKLNNTAPVHSGTHSVSFAAKGYEGTWFHNDAKYETKEYYGAEIWVHGGTTGGQKLRFVLQDGRSVVGSVPIETSIPGGIPANAWAKATLKFADMDITSPTFDGIVVQAWGEQNQGTIYFDDVVLLKNDNVVTLPEPEVKHVSVSIDTTADRRPVSKDIFGVNFEENPSDDASQMKFPLKRWGGNQMSRYNWELDVTNRAADWYFLNYTNDTPDPSQLPNGSLSDRFIAQSMADQTKVLLQIPTIGWTPKSRDVTWGFSISKYGRQSGNECDWHEQNCHADAGNGLMPDGRTYKTGNKPEDTSKPYGPDFMARWIDHLKGRFGNYVRYYALDNEPALWGHTHRDVHPEMTTYDEIWNYTVQYGSMIKQKDPEAKVFGPVSWGWCEYFYSAKDGCSAGSDAAAHGNKPFLDWYLSKVREYEQANHTRLVDVLDIHYYPAENGITFTSDESAVTSKRRLQALKSLFDPNYVDPSSWIQEPVRLLPRMQEIIDKNAPGTKLAITEYNFGDGGGISSGLAQAEALALFAREGVELATRWGGLPANTPLEDAFKLYLNYDGSGGAVEGDSVKATSSNFDAVGAYTIVSPAGKKFILLFNKDTVPRTTDVEINSDLSASAKVYRFDARQRLQFVQNVTSSQNSLSINLPARSATLLVSE
ncbi:glycoside hydrolase family 44 protein [Paenibacillus hamazuiensis]|uniref:glycoside hydrolase family 44 protein n=1 Tax=Paenibacillus hamazuiensis TaxID=2936508 RepID=UPI00200DCD53|nr:glycoside hydrolase family 44 protein [Paenibacillus hamazuiensis]